MTFNTKLSQGKVKKIKTTSKTSQFARVIKQLNNVPNGIYVPILIRKKLYCQELFKKNTNLIRLTKLHYYFALSENETQINEKNSNS